jgi:hypothetical protein
MKKNKKPGENSSPGKNFISIIGLFCRLFYNLNWINKMIHRNILNKDKSFIWANKPYEACNIASS